VHGIYLGGESPLRT